MKAPSWAAYVVAWLVTLALLLLSNYLRRRKLNPPPGPKPWPIIGNFNLIGSLPHRSLNELSKKYGPIMMVWYGSVPVVVGSSVEMARLFLKTHDMVLTGRPKTAAGKYTTYNYCDITWSQCDPYWRQARKICNIELFSAKRLESLEYMRVEELNSILKDIYKDCGKPILLKDYLTTLSLNVISRMVLGKNYLDKKEGSTITPDEFKKMIDEWFLLNGVLNLGDWIPSIKWLDVQGYEKRMKALAKKFDWFLEHVLDEHNDRRQKEMVNWVPQDTVDVVLELADDSQLEVKLDRISVKAFSQDLIVGGTESPAVRKPEVVAKATEELDLVICKDRWVQEKDIPSLPYMRAIAMETMRLHPIAPTLAPHMAQEQAQIQGYYIPKGSIILVNTFTIQRDPNVYERPEEFWPDRFVDKNIDVKGHYFELLPFGSGRRMCPGYNLGLKIIESSLANLLHGYTWKLPDNMKPEDVDMIEIYGLSNPKKDPLVACPEPRLPPHLYIM